MAGWGDNKRVLASAAAHVAKALSRRSAAQQNWQWAGLSAAANPEVAHRVAHAEEMWLGGRNIWLQSEGTGRGALMNSGGKREARHGRDFP